MIKLDLNQHIIDGTLWRAKEILQSYLATSTYDVALYEEYGQVLLAMGDTMEAGKYLFLSGVREAAYTEAISLYFKRHGHKDIHNILGTFPKSARQAKFNAYPKIVIQELERAGKLPEQVKARIDYKVAPIDSGFGWVPWIFGTLVLALVLGFIIQGIRGGTWLFQWIVG